MTVYVTGCLSASAVLATGWAMSELRRNPYPWAMVWFWMNLAAFCLASVYTVAYIILATTNITRGEWSNSLRWVSLVTWPLVWIMPAAVTAYVARSRRV